MIIMARGAAQNELINLICCKSFLLPSHQNEHSVFVCLDLDLDSAFGFWLLASGFWSVIICYSFQWRPKKDSVNC